MRRGVKAILGLSMLCVATWTGAEDTRKKWQFGGGISYWSTVDDIRSNSTTAYAPVDPAQAGSLPSIRFSDPRPDANELNQPTIDDSWKFDFNASFGITRWVAIELQGSYFRGSVGNVEFYTEDRHLPVNLGQVFGLQGETQCSIGPIPGPGEELCYQMSGPTDATTVVRNGFVPIGDLTEIPIQLSGVVRFRPESPFDPYIGAGIGYIFTSLDTGASEVGTPFVLSASTSAGENRVVTMNGFDDIQDFTNGLSVANIASGARAIITYPTAGAEGDTTIAGLSASVEDAPEVHMMGGVDYYFTNRFSMYIDARYVWAQSKVEVRIDDQNQILSGIRDHGCVNGAATCRTLSGNVVDTSNSVITNDTFDDVQDTILIQGGDIRLGGFSIGVGVKFTF